MRTRVTLIASVAAVMTATTPAGAQSANAEADVRLEKINNQYICTLDYSVPGANIRNEAAKAAGPMLGEVLFTYEHTIKGFAVRLAASPPNGRSPMAELKANNPKIANCEQDQTVKAFGRVSATADTVDWGVAKVGGPGVTSSHTAWIIDSGIDLDHPDLNVGVSESVSFVSGGPDDKNGHGTHVAGTIAAKANGTGVVGVSPGTKVVAVRVLGPSGSGSTSGVIKGVDYVGQHGQLGDVANMSLGGSYSKALNDAVVAASSKVKFTVAAGNDGADATNYSPASATGPNIYTVSAVDQSNKLASFSNYGSPVDWAEPGVSIRSTYKGGAYATMSGTSMAAPHLAGILVQGNVASCGAITGDKDSKTDQLGCLP